MHFFFSLNIQPHLQVLNVSGNHLNSIRDFDILSNLTQFLANDNDLKDLREVAHCLALWRSLWRLELSGNPLAQKNKYRDRVIVMSNSLGELLLVSLQTLANKQKLD